MPQAVPDNEAISSPSDSDDDEAAVARPRRGDSILVLRPEWLEKIFAGEKKLEIRFQCLQPGFRYIGTSSEIWGSVVLGEGYQITSMKRWKELMPLHKWTGQTKLPYKKTWAMPLQDLERWPKTLPYKRKVGPIGHQVYEPVSSDADVEDHPMEPGSADADNDVQERSLGCGFAR